MADKKRLAYRWPLHISVTTHPDGDTQLSLTRGTDDPAFSFDINLCMTLHEAIELRDQLREQLAGR